MTDYQRQRLLQEKSYEQIQKILYEHYKLSLSIPQIKKAIEDGKDFWFSKNASARDKMYDIMSDTVKKMETLITNYAQRGHDYGVRSYEYDVNKVLKDYATDMVREGVSIQYKTFDKHKLSERVWNLTQGTQQEIEIMAQNAVKQGMSAEDLSKDIRKYLNNPHTLFHRVKNKETGELELSQAAKDYNPGQGVYRSAYRNAMRLARTEINNAYREAQWQQYQNDPLVVGIKIQLSNNHTTLINGKPVPLTDICDELIGVYPKTFKWTGWHPQCRCVMTPVMCNKTEFGKYVRNEDYKPKQIKNMPKKFDSWFNKNSDRVTISNKRGTLPKFIIDNANKLGVTVNPLNTEAGRKIIKDALKSFNSYGSEWERAYFDEFSGGYNIIHKDHQFAKTGGGGDAEKKVGKMLAKYNGKQVQFLPEGEAKMPDIKFDNQTWDIKYIDKASEQTIRNRIRDAGKADNAIFYFTKAEKYVLLKNAVEREKGKYLKGQISNMPNIYFIDKNKILILLWKK